MADFSDIRRIVIGHDWQDIREWARALETLAELDDIDLDAVAATAPVGTAPQAA